MLIKIAIFQMNLLITRALVLLIIKQKIEISNQILMKKKIIKIQSTMIILKTKITTN